MKRTRVQPQRRMSLLRSMMTYHTKPVKTRNKESFSPVGPVYTHELTYDKDKNKMYCSKCISIGANNTITAGCDNFKTSSLAIGMQLVQITRFIASRIA